MKKKKFLAIILALSLLVALAFTTACDDKIDGADTSVVPTVLTHSADAPSQKVLDSAVSSAKAIFDDASLSTADKVCRLMDCGRDNLLKCYQFVYFNNTVGTTSLGDKQGTLVYQRTRKQNLEAKYDTTLKLPVNHNFGSIESSQITSAVIRLVTGGKYFRMEADNMAYDNDSHLIVASDWKKKSGKFNKDEDISSSQNVNDFYITALDFSKSSLIVADGATLERAADENGNVYYKLSFAADAAAANADPETMARLKNANSPASGLTYEKCEVTAEIWESGFFRGYTVTERWSGKLLAYSNVADNRSDVVFSYADEDMDMSDGIAIKDSLL